MGRPQRRTAEWKPLPEGVTAHGKIGNVLAEARLRARDRFREGGAWFRLVLLGVLLAVFGTIALTSILNIRPLPAMGIGEVAIVSGMAIGLLSIKIMRARILWDWLASGLFLIGVGHVLMVDQALARTSSFALFAVFGLGSATARIWIGLTAGPRSAGFWIYAAGCASTVTILLAVSTAIARIPFQLPLIISLDILLQGLAIMAFGFEAKAAL